MVHDHGIAVAFTRDRKVEAAFAAIYDRQSEEGRARLLAFCHLIDLADPLAIHFDIRPSGHMVLTLEAGSGVA